MTQRLFRMFLAVALCTGVIGISVVSSAAYAASPMAMVRAAHFSPDTPGVDVYLKEFSGGNTNLFVPNATYAGVSPYIQVKPGIYLVTMRPHGAAPSTPALLSWTLNAKAGLVYTIAGVGTGAARHGIVLHDELTQPPAGTGKVRVIQAASRAPKADVSAVNGPSLATNVSFTATTPYTQVPAGDWSLQARSVPNPALTTSGTVSIASGSVTSVLLLDGKQGGLAIRTVLDGASAPAPPNGAVPAGGGGMASVISGHGSGAPGWSLPITLIALTGLAVLAAVSRRRARQS
jgi:hypothetical protein